MQAPLHYSNVQLLDPQTKKPVRIGYRFLDDGTKVRAALRERRVCTQPLSSSASPWTADRSLLLLGASGRDVSEQSKC